VKETLPTTSATHRDTQVNKVGSWLPTKTSTFMLQGTKRCDPKIKFRISLKKLDRSLVNGYLLLKHFLFPKLSGVVPT
jgi:hypothetical protein